MDQNVDTPHTGPATSPRKRLSRRASIIGSVVALLILAGTGWLAWRLANPAPDSAAAGTNGRRSAPATTVGVATAERANIPIFLDSLGTVTPLATVRVSLQVSGVMEKVLFKEGQMVRAGDLLATIDPRMFEMALLQATGQRQRDEAQLDSARVTLQRFKTLLAQDSIARQDVDTQAALVKQLEATVVMDKAAEGTAKLNLAYTKVVAPVSGRIGLRTVDVGNVVSPSTTNGIAVITQLSPIDVVFAVPQDQAGTLQQNASGSAAMKAIALDRTRSTTLDTGVFASLDNQVDTTTGTVKAKARFTNNQQLLFPSQFVNVRLQVKTIENAVVVPVTALRHGSNGDYVYVVNTADRTVSLRTVQRGQATVEKVIISSGLNEGERVITEGADRLKDGASVVLPGDPPGGIRRQRPAGKGAGAPAAAASAPASTGPASAPVAAASATDKPAPASTTSTPAPPVDGPTAEQRRRMLDQVKDDPVALERRQRFFEQLDRGDPAAQARWRDMMEKRRQGGSAP
ncbi:efflux RND transporter periplasmic adaptor subunit [Polaromonas sp. UC242_47]|uniref:efflux RND transporter periplasmic adaptor subunit n=1 Tax=Polaromonas sp. UC242_47 TaxID=3374626 RepID=UPI0037AB7729